LNLDPPGLSEILTGVQDEAILAHLAGGVSVEQIVRADAVQREAVAGRSRFPLAKMA
jgi:hypothetical protein